MMGRQARASTVVMRHREPHDPGSSCLAYQPIPPGPTSPAGHIDRTPGPCHPPEARSGIHRTALTFIQATALTCRLLKVSRDYSSLYRMAAAIAPTLDQFFRGERCRTRVSRAPCGVWSAGLPSSVGRINPTGTE